MCVPQAEIDRTILGIPNGTLFSRSGPPDRSSHGKRTANGGTAAAHTPSASPDGTLRALAVANLAAVLVAVALSAFVGIVTHKLSSRAGPPTALLHTLDSPAIELK